MNRNQPGLTLTHLGDRLVPVDNSATPKEGNMPRMYGLEPDDPRYEDHVREWEGERVMNAALNHNPRCSCGSATCAVDR